ncbi:MAG: DNA-3-methyladenine glycosylase [Ignavibacteriae bacterium]|nr:DNA-3-methyladenine glycosylase [Ignavibacteriota bacterium]
MNNNQQKLPIEFYTNDSLVVAQNLLGKIFVFNNKKIGKKLSATIVDVEAYDGIVDEAAHTFNGKTRRNKIMFERGGYLYVYFTYGKHFCANIVTGKEGEGTAILLRGMEAIDGIESFSQNRFGMTSIGNKEKKNLLNGPGKICQAFGISKKQYGMDLLSNEIYLLDAPKIPKNEIVQTTRIGIKKSKELPWRFYIKDNPNVSKK